MELLFHFDMCAAIMLSLLILALCMRGLNKGRTNMAFCALLVVHLISCLADFLSIYYDSIFAVGSSYFGLRYLVDSIYFIARNLAAPLYIFYISSILGIWYILGRSSRVKLLAYIPFALDVVLLFLNIFNHKVFYYDEAGVYHRGPWLYMLYAVGFYYLLFSLVLILKYKRMLDVKSQTLLLLYFPINVLAVLVQYMFSHVRIEIMASAVLLIAIGIVVQKPEEYLDYVTNVQSYNSFFTEIRKAYLAPTPMSLLVFKFTNHKALRDSLGFERYSVVLREIADNIKSANVHAKARGEIYYLDNGTFIIMSTDSYDKQIRKLGEMAQEYAEKPVKVADLEVMLECRMCTLRYPEDIHTVEALTSFINDFNHKLPDEYNGCDIADIAQTKEFRMRNELDEIINRGILESNFQMYYQPIYSVKEDKFLSAEALIRLIDDEYGFVSPGLFIPVAEKSGAIHQIGDYVFEAVCKFMSGKEYKKLGMDYIEINLSVAQCIEYDLVEKFKRITKKKGVKPESINLEITETAMDYDPGITDINVTKLHDAGFTFSLDDYGTGYSNIRRVVSMPLDIVKLDKCLVDAMDDPKMWTVITNTVKMLKNMNKKILVEGVETKEAVERFTSLGCDYIQGFYYSKPLPEKEFVEFIREHNKTK